MTVATIVAAGLCVGLAAGAALWWISRPPPTAPALPPGYHNFKLPLKSGDVGEILTHGPDGEPKWMKPPSPNYALPTGPQGIQVLLSTDPTRWLTVKCRAFIGLSPNAREEIWLPRMEDGAIVCDERDRPSVASQGQL